MTIQDGLVKSGLPPFLSS